MNAFFRLCARMCYIVDVLSQFKDFPGNPKKSYFSQDIHTYTICKKMAPYISHTVPKFCSKSGNICSQIGWNIIFFLILMFFKLLARNRLKICICLKYKFHFKIKILGILIVRENFRAFKKLILDFFRKFKILVITVVWDVVLLVFSS